MKIKKQREECHKNRGDLHDEGISDAKNRLCGGERISREEKYKVENQKYDFKSL